MNSPSPDGFSGFDFSRIENFDFGKWITKNFVQVIIMFGATLLIFGWWAINKWG